MSYYFSTRVHSNKKVKECQEFFGDLGNDSIIG
jgi:hypothetical protein